MAEGGVLDTNLLLLHVIGSVDVRYLQQFKRTKMFVTEDFMRLQLLLEPFQTVGTTPSVLTEVSNLMNQLPTRLKPHYFAVFAEHIKRLSENHIPSTALAAHQQFLTLGLADVSVWQTAKDRYLVLSVDLPL